jgi:hypothetical protein
MSFLLPFLHHLQADDRDIARRFSAMATVILESHGSLPVIFVESMALVEILLMHSENPIFSCMPSVLAALTPARPAAFARGLWQPDCLKSSRKCLRAAIFIVTLIPSPHALESTWSDITVTSLLVATLEAVCGSRHFSGGNLLRSVAASRAIERFFTEGTALESEIFQAVHCLMPRKGCNGEIFLRWILFSRQVLARFSSESVSTKMLGFTRSDDISSAISRAESDSSCVYDTANPVRWQVKCLAAQIGQVCIGIQKSPHFDFTMANKVCAAECAQAADGASGLPSSRVIFHLEDILASACLSSVATLDQAELRTLQENAMHLLQKLIESFGLIKD